MVLGITMLMLGFITFNLISFQQETYINSAIDRLVSDIKNQQAKAMAGASDDGAGNSFGAYFESDRYVLFAGSSYSDTDTSNFTVMLDTNTTFANITFPASTLVFSQKSGEINGLTDGNNSITINENQGLSNKAITLNKYGVITGIN